jgi:hypothetical protein
MLLHHAGPSWQVIRPILPSSYDLLVGHTSCTSGWHYYKEICYDARSYERKIRIKISPLNAIDNVLLVCFFMIALIPYILGTNLDTPL